MDRQVMGYDPTDFPAHIQRQIAQKDYNRKTTSGPKAFTGERQRIFINHLPPMLNGPEGLQRLHWTEYQRIKKRWTYYLALQGPQRHLGKVNIRFTRVSTVTPDPDNAAAGFKVVGDALVDAGVIEDDSFDVIRRFDVRWKKARTMREQGVIIEIEDCK